MTYLFPYRLSYRPNLLFPLTPSLLFALPIAMAAPLPPGAEDEAGRQQHHQLLREQQRQQQLQQQLQPDADVRLDSPELSGAVRFSLDQPENPCFPIRQITLEGEAARYFQFALQDALNRSGFKPGMCLGAQGINHIMTLTQNTVIGEGYTTSRILAAPQDLNRGDLVLTAIPGRIRQIRVDLENSEATHADRIRSWQNEFPTASGEILNLRDLEQGLENLKRVPTAEADIQIVPGEAPDESDVVVLWRQRSIPIRLSLGADDSGSRQTGKYQGNLTVSVDNPLGLSDLFYASLSRDLGHKSRLTDQDGHATNSRTRSYAVHYSVPLGRWLLAANHNYYRYHQAVAGAVENYDYNGSSNQTDIGITRLLYRDARRKTQLNFKLWTRSAKSFINDAEIEVQRRRTAGWMLNLGHKEYIGQATLNLDLGYKRGTGWNNSLRAPEEAFGEGTSRMEIITATAGINVPVQIGRQPFAYDGHLHLQWHKTPLTPQDRLAIGSRYTVRGFDGEMSLAAERGWYWRNDWSWQYHPGHQVYMGADVGHVAGPSAVYLPGRTLAGAVLGAKGQFRFGGALYYDVFIGRPLKKPDGFKTADYTAGFQLNYSF